MKLEDQVVSLELAKKLKNLLLKFQIWYGSKSPCCHADTFIPIGWDRVYCSKCDKRL